MKIEMLMPIAGMFHGHIDVQRGDVLDVEEAHAVRYCTLGYAQPTTKTAEKAVAREERAIERAALTDFETTAVEAQAESQPDADLGLKTTEVPKPLDEVNEEAAVEAVEANDSARGNPAKRGTATPNAKRR